MTYTDHKYCAAKKEHNHSQVNNILVSRISIVEYSGYWFYMFISYWLQRF